LTSAGKGSRILRIAPCPSILLREILMIRSLQKTLALAVILACCAGGAMAQTTGSTPNTAPTTSTGHGKNGPCMSEHEAVVAQCQKGDPCGASCKQAHQAMRACRQANHLPVHTSNSGVKKPNPCKTTGGSTGSAPGGSAPPASP
jgi:hypothetical protein